MASLIYTAALEALARGQVDFAEDQFKLLLVGASYVANRGHVHRSEVSGEVSGAGYTAGGKAVTLTVSKDGVNGRVDITPANVTWEDATITARGAILYQVLGTAADDLLVAYVDFGEAKSASGGPFTVTFTEPLRIAGS